MKIYFSKTIHRVYRMDRLLCNFNKKFKEKSKKYIKIKKVVAKLKDSIYNLVYTKLI